VHLTVGACTFWHLTVFSEQVSKGRRRNDEWLLYNI
jgi:hypothetical protein